MLVEAEIADDTTRRGVNVPVPVIPGRLTELRETVRGADGVWARTEGVRCPRDEGVRGARCVGESSCSALVLSDEGGRVRNTCSKARSISSPFVDADS